MKLAGVLFLFGTFCCFTILYWRFEISDKNQKLKSKIISVFVAMNKSYFELLEETSLISQLDNYCFKHKIADSQCELAFVRTLQMCYRQKIRLTIPLYDLFDEVTKNCTKVKFMVTLFGGPVHSQIDKFCSLNKCSNNTRDHLVKTIRSHGGYWFPLADITLFKASSNQTSGSSSNSSKKSLVEPGWTSIINEFNTVVNKRKHDSHRLEKMRSHRRVFYGIFAGRLDQMPIHLAYTDLLLDAHLVTEVHIWDFTTDLNDTEYLSAFVRDSPRGAYHLFRRPYKDNKRISRMNEGYLFQSFYKHYCTNKRYRPDDIIIKADDDIVFIDISRFDSFVNDMSNKHLYFPNIINNDVGLVIQGNRNAHPSLEFILQSYQAQGSNLTSLMNRSHVSRPSGRVNVCPLSAIYCNDTMWQLHDWRQALFVDGIAAKMIHDSFLEDPFRFIEKSRVRGERYVELRRRISINMIAGRASYLRSLFGKFLTKESCCDDEGYVGKWPLISNDSHVIDTHFTIVHFAFAPQRSTYDGNITADLARYAAIVNGITAGVDVV